MQQSAKQSAYFGQSPDPNTYAGNPSPHAAPPKKKRSGKNKEYDYFMKIVLVGQSSVGKSSLMLRFTDDKFNESYVNTIGVDFRFRTLQINDKRIKMQIWDTAGQEKFRTMTSTYYRGADAIIIVYDITDASTYDEINTYWTNELARNDVNTPFIVMVGNKKDLDSARRVPRPQSDFVPLRIGDKEWNVRTAETSAKSASGVHELFEELAKEFMVMKEENRRMRPSEGGIPDRESVGGSIGGPGGDPKLTKQAIKPDETKKGCKC